MADNLTPEQRSRAMSRIRSTGTGPEVKLRKELWKRELRGYRLNVNGLPGRPDIAWRRKRLAIFVDGAFWHGHPRAFREGKSGDYWDKKIRRNIERDRNADKALLELGWRVLRFWDFEVKADVKTCVDVIEDALKGRRRMPPEATGE